MDRVPGGPLPLKPVLDHSTRMAEIEDFQLIEKAGFTHNTKFVAQAVVSSLSFLKSLSSKLGIPIEQITAEHIVRELSQTDAQIREHEAEVRSFCYQENLKMEEVSSTEGAELGRSWGSGTWGSEA